MNIICDSKLQTNTETYLLLKMSLMCDDQNK